MSPEIQHLNSISAAFDETSGEFLALPEGFFEMGDGHRHHPVMGGLMWVGEAALKSSIGEENGATRSISVRFVDQSKAIFS